MRSRLPLAAGLAAGVTLDALLGDPRHGHPVAAFGRAAAALEARDYADSRPRGAAHAAACVLAAAAPAVLLHRRTRDRPPLQAAAVALTVWAVTGARSLHHEAERIMVSLAGDDLRAAREALPSLCGRDPDRLGADQITRAVIESVAENTSDAIVAPLLWGAVAGLPGLAAYRAVNTLDAMVGHRSPRYLRFGWASARLDDAMNWIPARVTAALTIACAAITPLPAAGAWPSAGHRPAAGAWPSAGHRPAAGAWPSAGHRPAAGALPSAVPWPPAASLRTAAPLPATAAKPAASAQVQPAGGRLVPSPATSAWRTVLRYGHRHPSPNAGRCEAAFAGALGLRLGGTNVYGGVTETRPELGDGRDPEPADIRRAVRLSRAVTVAATVLAVLLALCFPARLRALVTRRLPSSLCSSVQASARPLARGTLTRGAGRTRSPR
jgi:adenosylcobinamide-phosphate synthase